MTRWDEIKCPRCAELEAKLAKAVKALDEAHTSMMNNYDGEAFITLDTALAELGEDNA